MDGTAGRGLSPLRAHLHGQLVSLVGVGGDVESPQLWEQALRLGARVLREMCRAYLCPHIGKAPWRPGSSEILALQSTHPPSWAGLGNDGDTQSASHVAFLPFPFSRQLPELLPEAGGGTWEVFAATASCAHVTGSAPSPFPTGKEKPHLQAGDSSRDGLPWFGWVTPPTSCTLRLKTSGHLTPHPLHSSF